MAVQSFATAMAVAAISISFIACQKDISSVQQGAPSKVLSSGVDGATAAKNKNGKVEMSTVKFGPVSTNFVNTCYENIRFEGMIENKVMMHTDGNGSVHYTRHFTAKGMTGVGLRTGDIYDVVGGAEMFSVKDPAFNPNGSLNVALSGDVFIHQGTLVFVSRKDGRRIVARHIIRKVPGSDTVVNEWVCQGK